MADTRYYLDGKEVDALDVIRTLLARDGFVHHLVIHRGRTCELDPS